MSFAGIPQPGGDNRDDVKQLLLAFLGRDARAAENVALLRRQFHLADSKNVG